MNVLILTEKIIVGAVALIAVVMGIYGIIRK